MSPPAALWAGRSRRASSSRAGWKRLAVRSSTSSPGDAVSGVTLFNGYATHVCVPADLVWPKPQALDFEAAAGFLAVHLTAYHGLLQNVVIRPGMSVLVHSAAGGVGSALVQLCKLHDLRAIGVVGASHKVEYLRQLGANAVIDKSRQSLWDEAK